MSRWKRRHARSTVTAYSRRIISRTLAIALTAMYDAWAAYDERAIGTRLGASLRRPAPERTAANKEKAIAYATYRALADVYPEDKAWIDDQMRQHGFDPGDASTDRSTPQGIGNVAAAAVCAYRHHDGANQFGDEVGSNGVPYSDYTYYAPVNTLGMPSYLWRLSRVTRGCGEKQAHPGQVARRKFA